MQIRVGNRQDEPIIRTIVSQAMEEYGQVNDPQGVDADLNDIEANYFWYDGVFLVAEEDGQVIGLAGARRHQNDDQDSIELVRLVVTPARRGRGIATALLDRVLFFARNSEYKKLVIYAAKQGFKEVVPLLGFKQTKEDGLWSMELR